MNKNKILLGAGLLLMTAVGCQKEDAEVSDRNEDTAQNPISFYSEINDDEVSTRATFGLYNYHKTFKLNGVKIKNSQEEKVMSSYWVQYLTSKSVWEYVYGRQDSVKGQIEKYWDYEATEYHFIAGSPYNKTTINSSTSLTIDTLKMQSTNSASGTISTGYLFSEPEKIEHSDFNKTVMMTFSIAMARVKVAIYCAEEQTENMTLSDITFAPTSGSYVTEGKLKIDYDFTKTTPSFTQTVTAIKSLSSALTLENVDLTVPCTTQEFSPTIYYVLPLSSSAVPVPWTLTIGSITDNNTATVPAEYMNWQPGRQYVYVFKLSNATTDPTIHLVDCSQTAITGWDSGETMTPDMYNW